MTKKIGWWNKGKLDIDQMSEDMGDVYFTEKQSMALAHICEHVAKNEREHLLEEIEKLFKKEGKNETKVQGMAQEREEDVSSNYHSL